MYIPHCSAFICPWTFWLLSLHAHCEWCCDKLRCENNLFETVLSFFFFYIYPEVVLLNHMIVFNFLRNLYIIFHSSCNILWSYQYSQDLQFLCIPCLHLLFPLSLCFCFVVVAILMAVKWYLIVVLVCISLMISDLSIFSYACWPAVYHLWRKVCPRP